MLYYSNYYVSTIGLCSKLITLLYIEPTQLFHKALLASILGKYGKIIKVYRFAFNIGQIWLNRKRGWFFCELVQRGTKGKKSFNPHWLRCGTNTNCILEFPQTHINTRFLSLIDNFGSPLDDQYHLLFRTTWLSAQR